jgi:hypothetical protein
MRDYMCPCSLGVVRWIEPSFRGMVKGMSAEQSEVSWSTVNVVVQSLY